MNVISIEPTKKTPAVELNTSDGVLKMSGRSMPEDATEFYEPLINWFKEYAQSPGDGLMLEMHLDYFNTSSSKNLLEIFKCVAEAGNGNKVGWFYDIDDEDMQEAGEDFIFIIGESIELIEK